MARTVAKILKEDEGKAELGVTEEELAQLNEDDTPPGPTPEETATQLKEQLAETQRQLDVEATARREAEARAERAANTAGNAVNNQVAIQKSAILSRAEAAKTNLEAIKHQLKQATAAQDHDAVVDLQDAMTNARYELNAAEWDQRKFTEWETANKNRPAQPQQPAATGRAPGTYTQAEQDWINRHPQFKTSKRFARITKDAAADAERNGHAVDSVGYFAWIEDSLREEGLIATEGDPTSGAGRNTGGSASIAAGPNHSGNGANPPVNKNAKYPFIPNGFRIPAEWVQAATDQGFDDPREYANMRLEDEAKQSSRQ